MITFLFAAMLSVASAAGTLTGEWGLDPAASDSVEPMLEAQGVSWATRKLSAKSTPRLEISQSGNEIKIVGHTPKGTSTEVFVADGAPHPTVGPDGESATWTSTWEGDTLVSTRPVSLAQGKSGQLSIRRKLEGSGYVQVVELAITGGETLTARRVFNAVVK